MLILGADMPVGVKAVGFLVVAKTKSRLGQQMIAPLTAGGVSAAVPSLGVGQLQTGFLQTAAADWIGNRRAIIIIAGINIT